MKSIVKRFLGLVLAVGIVLTQQSPLFSQPLPVQLELKGEGVKVVDVDKVIIVKVKMTVVDVFPVTVSVPPDKYLVSCRWQYPRKTVEANDNDTSLEIVSAPKGELRISVTAKYVELDKDGKFQGLANKVGSIAFSVGTPTPPDPPLPTDAFSKAVLDAYVADGKPVAQVAQLAALYRQSATTVNNLSNKTAKDVLDTMHKAAVSLVGDATTVLPKTRRVIADELNKTLANMTTLTPDNRSTITAAFVRVQVALEGCK